jgi:hypothetical protein
MDIFLDRDGANATDNGSITNAQSSWFADPATADLHLVGTTTAAIDRAASLTQVTDDFDGDTRPQGLAPDVGADEYIAPTPTGVTDLRVSRAVADSTTLTVTLTWTPPAEAITATLRYSGALISEDNWNEATLLTDALSSSAGTFTAVVGRESDQVYFAHRWQDKAGTWSRLSNNAFWPSFSIYLPLVMRID